MSTETQHLVQQSLRGDRDAFGEIVARYQSTVSAVAYSVTGNLAQSEDLAQEAFIIAWKKLGTLQKEDAIAPWLCSIVRNLARNWNRMQARRPTVSMETVGEQAHPTGESPDAQQEREERADLVWNALADIPESYREPLILFYRQGESVRAIAEALELSEDNVKQRLSRGRKMLRAEVESLVETTLTDTRPGKAFTASVVAALPALYGAKATAAETTGAGAQAAAPITAATLLFKYLLPVAATVAVVGGGVWWATTGRTASTADDTPSPRNPVTYQAGAPDSEGVLPVRDTLVAPAPVKADASDATLAADPGATVTGKVVFEDTGNPAPAMRVLLGTEGGSSKETLSGEDGRFTFEGVPAGEYAVLAYDARYGELPEDDFRSKQYPITVAAGEVPGEFRIAVPPDGGVLSGRITDAKTGEPLEGLTVEVLRMGTTSLEDTSEADGAYCIVGLQEGSWLVTLDRQNPIFTSSSVADMETIIVGADLNAHLDMTVDRGVPVRGRVVDIDGRPVPDAGLNAEVFRAEGGGRHSCYFRTDEAGAFTVWGAQPGDRAVVDAHKDGRASPIAVVSIEKDQAPDAITLRLAPKVTIAGRFLDEQGRPTPALLWHRPLHPDGPGSWSGVSDDPAPEFREAFAPGTYELKGRVDDHDFGAEEQAQVVELGTESVDDLVLRVPVTGADTGDYRLSGRVVDEQGAPLKGCRVYIHGTTGPNMRSFQDTRTGQDGRFSFNGLINDQYDVKATPPEPYEDFPGFDRINPAEQSEITIVVRKAGQLRGRVVDARTGKPITQFEVECGEQQSLGREHEWKTLSINTDDGAFSVPARLDKDWYLRISANGYTPEKVTGGALSSGEETPIIEFKLRPGMTARGTVTTHDGEPVAQALLYLSSDVFRYSRRTARSAVAETDAEGRFEIGSIPEDADTVYAWKDGFSIAQAPLADEVHLVLTAGGVIEGRVTVGGAVPGEAYRVSAICMENGDGRSATSDVDGFYRLENLMAVPYVFSVTSTSNAPDKIYYMLDEPIVPEDGTVVTANIDIPVTGTTAHGSVTSAGAPVPGVLVRCAIAGLTFQTSADEQGNFSIENVPPGMGTMRILVPQVAESGGVEMRVLLEEPVEIPAGDELTHDMVIPSLTG